jgi:hypothetical protein
MFFEEAIGYMVVGIYLLKKLNQHFEELYDEYKKSVIPLTLMSEYRLH